jgi:CysZ protein
MEKLISAAFKSLRAIAANGMGAVFVKSILITLLFLASLVALMSYAGNMLAAHYHDWAYAAYLPWLTGIGSAILAWLLFPGIMPLIVSFFDESIIAIIEKTEYPGDVTVSNNSWQEDFGHDIKFAAKALLLNIIVLPLYLIPVVNFFVFLALNGHLLGREFYLTVARRHLSLAKSLELQKNNSSLVFFGGVMIVFFSTVPLINLIAPFWGIALMTHLYHASAK